MVPLVKTKAVDMYKSSPVRSTGSVECGRRVLGWYTPKNKEKKKRMKFLKILYASFSKTKEYTTVALLTGG